MQDDDPVLGESTRSGDEPGPPVPKMWMAVAGLATVLAIVLSSGSGLGPADTTVAALTTSTTTIPTRPTVSVPSTLPMGEIVDRTLVWEEPIGLEEAIHIGGVAEFDGDHWMIGATTDGLAAWTADGDVGSWRLVSVFGGGEQWVDDVEVVGDRLVVAASAPPGRRRHEGGALYQTSDGVGWVRHHLRADDPELSLTTADRIISSPEGVVVSGFAHTAPPPLQQIQAIPPAVSELVERGVAWIDVFPDGALVFLLPGIQLARIPPEEIPEGYGNEDSRHSRQLWEGDTLDSLTPRETEVIPFVVAPTDGGFVGRVGNRLATSDDGLRWAPQGPVLDGIRDFTAWEQGVVVLAGERGEPRYWTPGSGETAPVLPEGMLEESSQLLPPVVRGEWGMAMLRMDTWSQPMSEPVLIAATQEGELYLEGSYGRFELRRDGERVWSRGSAELEVSIPEGGRLRFGPQPDTITLEVPDWLEGISRRGRAPSTAVSVLHTPDGSRWSMSSWEDTTGLERAASPTLLAAHDFVVAVDQSSSFGLLRVNGVAIGTPLG